MNTIERIKKLNKEELICYHCGDKCKDDSFESNGKLFCCNGCKTVFELLEENDLCDYYSFESNPGVKKRSLNVRNFDFLDDAKFVEKFVEFDNGEITSVKFYIPQIHCSSCIWILENLHKLDNGILLSRTDFLKKELDVRFQNSKTDLRRIVELLDSLGYSPDLSNENSKALKQSNKKLYYRIGIAGFAFGNIMLLSFPDYLSFSSAVEPWLKNYFGYLSLLLSVPVLLYSAFPYFESAFLGLKKKIVNIDVPVSLGIITLFVRSAADVAGGYGTGYFDSFAGLIFFLLIGKLFQSKTYEALNFERTYKSYFPVSILIKKGNFETTVPLENLKVGQKFIARNGEIIPADSVLLSNRTFIDYSFVTGESAPVELASGDIIYAGGRQIGGAIELEAVKDVSQSYLTKLWQHSAFRKEGSLLNDITNSVSKYFTFAVLGIAVSAGIYWLFANASESANVFTAVLIVACPCALALSTPFTLGNSLRILGRNKFYLKDSGVVEKIASVTDIVFDKTGTITKPGLASIRFRGNLTDEGKSLIKSASSNSYHPLSAEIAKYFAESEVISAGEFEETPGKGIKSSINNRVIKLGSADFVSGSIQSGREFLASEVHVSIDGEYKGVFAIRNKIRNNFDRVINSLKNNYNMALISGDSSNDKEELSVYFPKSTLMLFGKKPEDKLEFVKKLQLAGRRVLMIGDGLNDAGALAQADVGIAVSENVNNFSPACDAIIEGESFGKLAEMIFFSKSSKNIIIISFVISFFYNFIGLSFAVTGELSPLVAAILMPLSSISIVLFTTIATNLISGRKGL